VAAAVPLAGALPDVRAASSADPAILGQIGGEARAVAAEGRYVYLGMGPRVLVLDVRDPTAPVQVGQSPVLPAVVEGIVVAGGRAYVADGRDGGLQILDVTDPTRVTVLGGLQVGAAVNAVAADGSHVFLAVGEPDRYGGGIGSLRVVNVADAVRPREVGREDITGIAAQISLAGGHAYVSAFRPYSRAQRNGSQESGGAGELDVAVIDISDPRRPNRVSRLRPPGGAYGIAVSGEVAYVAEAPDSSSGARSRLWLYDVSGPVPPVRHASVDMGPAPCRNMVVDRSRLYAACASLIVVDVSDLDRPRVMQAPCCLLGDQVGALALGNGRLFLTRATGGLDVVDAREPTSLVVVASFERPASLWDVRAEGGQVVASDIRFGEQVLHSVDISIPASPIYRGGHRFDQAVIDGLALSGRRVFVGLAPPFSWYEGLGVRALEIGSDGSPHVTAQLDVTATMKAASAVGDHLYLTGHVLIVPPRDFEQSAEYEARLAVIDASDPSRLSILGQIPLDRCGEPVDDAGYVSHIAVAGSQAFVTGDGCGLQVVDVADSANPRVSATIDLDHGTFDLALDGGYAFVLSDDGSLIVYDVSVPAVLQEVSRIHWPGRAGRYWERGQAVAAWKGHAYVAEEVGVRIIDIGDPRRPVDRGLVRTPGNALAVDVSDGVLYVADDVGGLLALDVERLPPEPPPSPTATNEPERPRPTPTVAPLPRRAIYLPSLGRG